MSPAEPGFYSQYFVYCSLNILAAFVANVLGPHKAPIIGDYKMTLHGPEALATDAAIAFNKQ